MARVTVITAGFYGNPDKFLSAGESYEDGEFVEVAADEGTVAPQIDLFSLTKDELLAEAEKRGVEVKASMTKAEIIAALGG